MIRGTSLTQPKRLDEPLDIDEETLDSALMDLLTSDRQPLDEGDMPSTGALGDSPPPSEQALPPWW